MIFDIVLAVLIVALVIVQGFSFRKLSKLRRLNRTGFEFCIAAVDAHTRGEDWRPAMEKAKQIQEELNQL